MIIMSRKRSRSPNIQSGRRIHHQARRSRSRSPGPIPSRRNSDNGDRRERPRSDSNLEKNKKSVNEKDRKFFQQLRRKSSSRHEDRQKSPQPPQPLSDKEDDVDEIEWDDNWGLGKRSKPDYCFSEDEVVGEDLFDLQNMMGFGAFDTTKTKNKLEKIVLSGSISENREKERKRFEERKFERLYGKIGTGRKWSEKSSHPPTDSRRRRSRSPDFQNQRSRSPDFRNQRPRSPDFRNQKSRSPDFRYQRSHSPDFRHQRSHFPRQSSYRGRRHDGRRHTSYRR